MADDLIAQRYLEDGYHEKNPSWDIEDSPWKAEHVHSLLVDQGLKPHSVAEVGCGAGGVLVALRRKLPDAALYGFDIAPAAASFWDQHDQASIAFLVGDFFESGGHDYDVILLLDVLEHLANPFDFLARIRAHAKYFVFHFPLDLSALSVMRETPLLYVRHKVGHIHYFTKGLALTLLEECGFEVLDARYTGAAFNAPRRHWTTRLAGLARRVVYAINKEAGVRLLGGETLMVLARPRQAP